MPRTSLRRLSTLAAVRAAAAARRVGPVHGNLLSVMGLLMEKSLQKREREESTPRRTPVRKRKRPAPQEPSTSTPLAGSEPFCITLYHPQAHLEQSALLLLFYDFFGSHRSPLGSANKSKNQLLYLSCVLSNFIHPSWTFILLQLQIFTLHSFLELQRWYAYGWTRKR